jgi:hypothetical protein
MPVKQQPFEVARAVDENIVRPGYLTEMRNLLDQLKPLPAEPDESDDEPLI